MLKKKNPSKSQFTGERCRRRAHRGLLPCITLQELHLITVCCVHKQLVELGLMECPPWKVFGRKKEIQSAMEKCVAVYCSVTET